MAAAEASTTQEKHSDDRFMHRTQHLQRLLSSAVFFRRKICGPNFRFSVEIAEVSTNFDGGGGVGFLIDLRFSLSPSSAGQTNSYEFLLAPVPV